MVKTILFKTFEHDHFSSFVHISKALSFSSISRKTLLVKCKVRQLCASPSFSESASPFQDSGYFSGLQIAGSKKERQKAPILLQTDFFVFSDFQPRSETDSRQKQLTVNIRNEKNRSLPRDPSDLRKDTNSRSRTSTTSSVSPSATEDCPKVFFR
ncbi:hypothetical protein M9H77_13440 [Catharanthus roseus]|uniref:Uncharacterized protein n=1 Tax=Catharanthus roseus TaxID=4058 RepID=A0ACC0BKF6_CATRO|nr:hypothetical protein M9H77_13440 [Catharanthus roseus]